MDKKNVQFSILQKTFQKKNLKNRKLGILKVITSYANKK